MSGGVDHSGLDALLASLDDVDRDLANGSILDEALTEFGGILLNQAKRNCPRRTGNLSDSQEVEIDGNAVVLRAKAEYASDVHDGNSRQQSQPWMEISADEVAHEMQRCFNKAVARRMP